MASAIAALRAVLSLSTSPAAPPTLSDPGGQDLADMCAAPAGARGAPCPAIAVRHLPLHTCALDGAAFVLPAAGARPRPRASTVALPATAGRMRPRLGRVRARALHAPSLRSSTMCAVLRLAMRSGSPPPAAMCPI